MIRRGLVFYQRVGTDGSCCLFFQASWTHHSFAVFPLFATNVSCIHSLRRILAKRLNLYSEIPFVAYHVMLNHSILRGLSPWQAYVGIMKESKYL
jgi:hypothetical protein